MKNKQIYLLILAFVLQFGCTTLNDFEVIHFKGFEVIHQTIGPSGTNCYLIYDLKSKEVAIIDPGWRDNTLINFIKENNLNLKYILLTHGHKDHFAGAPDIKKQFPSVKLCLNKEDISDYQYIGIPDLFVEESQTLKLGSLEINTIHTPGHSPGGICYYTKNILFAGDVLFYRSVGVHPEGSKENLIKSVRKLYEKLPDSTIVYPGHGRFTIIGSEKTENEEITLNKENVK